MGHRRAPQAELDLDSIWHYVASESGSLDVADRFIGSITERFFLSRAIPYLGRARDEDLRPGVRSLPAGRRMRHHWHLVRRFR
jgi:toxin ParE1/3/4